MQHACLPAPGDPCGACHLGSGSADMMTAKREIMCMLDDQGRAHKLGCECWLADRGALRVLLAEASIDLLVPGR